MPFIRSTYDKNKITFDQWIYTDESDTTNLLQLDNQDIIWCDDIDVVYDQLRESEPTYLDNITWWEKSPIDYYNKNPTVRKYEYPLYIGDSPLKLIELSKNITNIQLPRNTPIDKSLLQQIYKCSKKDNIECTMWVWVWRKDKKVVISKRRLLCSTLNVLFYRLLKGLAQIGYPLNEYKRYCWRGFDKVIKLYKREIGDDYKQLSSYQQVLSDYIQYKKLTIRYFDTTNDGKCLLKWLKSNQRFFKKEVIENVAK